MKGGGEVEGKGGDESIRDENRQENATPLFLIYKKYIFISGLVYCMCVQLNTIFRHSSDHFSDMPQLRQTKDRKLLSVSKKLEFQIFLRT